LGFADDYLNYLHKGICRVGDTERASHWYVVVGVSPSSTSGSLGLGSGVAALFPSSVHFTDKGIARRGMHVRTIGPEILWKDCEILFAGEAEGVVHSPQEEKIDLSWIELAEQPASGTPSADLVTVIDGINVLLKQGRFFLIDKIFRSLSLEAMEPRMMLAFARTTFPVRTKLDEWRSFVSSVANELDKRGLDSQSLLRGLVK
jgi:hypothetical protein